MKKIITILLAAALTTIAVTASFAAGATTSGGFQTGDVSIGAPALLFKLSNNVYMNYASLDQTAYAIITYHNKGTKSFASSSGDSKIFEAQSTNCAAGITIPTGTASAGFSSLWTAL